MAGHVPYHVHWKSPILVDPETALAQGLLCSSLCIPTIDKMSLSEYLRYHCP